MTWENLNKLPKGRLQMTSQEFNTFFMLEGDKVSQKSFNERFRDQQHF